MKKKKEGKKNLQVTWSLIREKMNILKGLSKVIIKRVLRRTNLISYDYEVKL